VETAMSYLENSLITAEHERDESTKQQQVMEQEVQKVRDPNVKRGDILENVMNDFAALYDEETEANQKLSDEQKKFLPQISEVFYNFSDELKSEVYKVLNIITKQTQEEEYNNEYFEEEVGLRNLKMPLLNWHQEISKVPPMN
jgi:hypothetical protein